MDEETKQQMIDAYNAERELSLAEIHERRHKVGYKSPPLHTRFKKGNPGGPGRPSRGPIYHALKKALLESDETLVKIIVRGIIARAIDGRPSDIRLILLITDGRTL
jgi:hypothetical protein